MPVVYSVNSIMAEIKLVISNCLTYVLHWCEPDPVYRLLGISGRKPEALVYLNSIGRGIYCKLLLFIILSHSVKQLPTDTFSVVFLIHKEQANMLGLTHGKHTDELFLVKSSIESHSANKLPIIKCSSEFIDAFLYVLRRLVLKKHLPCQITGRGFFSLVE